MSQTVASNVEIKPLAKKPRAKKIAVPQPESESLLRPTNDVVDIILSLAKRSVDNNVDSAVKPKPRAKRVLLSEEQKEALRVRLQKAREVKQSKKVQ